MNLIIINYGSGNLHSVHKAFEAVNNELSKPFEIIVTNKSSDIEKADKIVLPGVGAFQDCKNAILRIDGLYESIEKMVIEEKKPFMGICVGMQLLAEKSYEFGECEGFGWIPGEVIKLDALDDCKIPHMGWNEIISQKHVLFNDILQGTDFYFVHSYYFKTKTADHCIATTSYPNSITAAVCKENMFGTQFHPEKSHKNGKKIIDNFLKWETV